MDQIHNDSTDASAKTETEALLAEYKNASEHWFRQLVRGVPNKVSSELPSGKPKVKPISSAAGALLA